MANAQIAAAGSRPRPTSTSFAMQASFLSSSIEEEDFIENIQPNLIESTSADSCSSHIILRGKDMVSRPSFGHTGSPTLDFEGSNNAEAKPSRSKGSTLNLNKSVQEYASRPTRPKTKLSLSMHDISDIPTYPLTPKSSHLSSSTIQSHSIATNASTPKSKDSGFPRSSSCFSLNSNRSNRYAHVPCTVTAYRNQIKAENEPRRRNSSKGLLNNTKHVSSPSEQNPAHDEAISVEALVPLIHKLEDEIEDKNKMLSTLQENYDSLLLKYAESKNQVDHLRCRPHTAGVVSPSPFNFETTDYKKPQASPSLLLLPKLHELQKEPSSVRSKQSHKGHLKGHPVTLSPVTKAYSSSVRLDKLFQHPLAASELNRSDKPPSASATQCNPLEAIRVGSSSVSLLEQTEVQSNHQLLVHKELSPERLNQQFSDNPFIKVKRWQESLPSFELIEPGNNYDSLNSRASNDNETFESQYFNQISIDSVSSKHNTSHVTKDDTSISTNASNAILSRSISQPNNYIFAEHLATNELNTSSCQSPFSAPSSKSSRLNFDPHWVPHLNTDITSSGVTGALSNGTPLLTINRHSKLSQNPSFTDRSPPASRHKASGSTDNSHFNRKKLLGQKARLILFDYLKTTRSTSTIPFCNAHKNSHQQVKAGCSNSVSKVELDGGCNDDEEDEDITLGRCLDAINRSCTNMRGKSEAIIQVLSKQLKENNV